MGGWSSLHDGDIVVRLSRWIWIEARGLGAGFDYRCVVGKEIVCGAVLVELAALTSVNAVKRVYFIDGTSN